MTGSNPPRRRGLSITIPPRAPVPSPATAAPRDQQNVDSIYTKGPVHIGPHSVYISCDPDMETLGTFDVVMNVAREISDPLLNGSYSQVADSQILERMPHIQLRTYRDAQQNTIEYYSVPWDHSSHVVEDLEALTEIIQNRARSGRRILVHCNYGVSRSASLIVAYVMRELQLDLTSACNYVRERSPVISPNLELMQQVLEWHQMRI